MESTDKLRMLADACYTFNDCSDKLMDLADEIEREIAERYMLLPVDADGVPIRVGDVLECEPSGTFTVGTIGENECVSEDGRVLIRFVSRVSRHVKPRTIEDVLRDILNDEMAKSMFDEVREQYIAKYADELRSIGVGE